MPFSTRLRNVRRVIVTALSYHAESPRFKGLATLVHDSPSLIRDLSLQGPTRGALASCALERHTRSGTMSNRSERQRWDGVRFRNPCTPLSTGAPFPDSTGREGRPTCLPARCEKWLATGQRRPPPPGDGVLVWGRCVPSRLPTRATTEMPCDFWIRLRTAADART